MEFENKNKREIQKNGIYEKNKNSPIKYSVDKEDYFIMKFECPNCGTSLGGYTYGRERQTAAAGVRISV